jgi:tRNA 2-thiouridine synthesizing protein B
MSIAAETTTLHQLTGHRGFALPATLSALCRPGDALVLMQEAVWLALAEAAAPLLWEAIDGAVAVHVLGRDLETRGLGARQLHPRIQRIDDAHWVELSERCQRSVTWSGG